MNLFVFGGMLFQEWKGAGDELLLLAAIVILETVETLEEGESNKVPLMAVWHGRRRA